MSSKTDRLMRLEIVRLMRQPDADQHRVLAHDFVLTIPWDPHEAMNFTYQTGKVIIHSSYSVYTNIKTDH